MLIYGPYSCQINVLGPILMVFFLMLAHAHALQLERNKVGYTKFVKFQLQSMSSKIERAFEKTKQKNMFIFILPIQTFRSFLLHFF